MIHRFGKKKLPAQVYMLLSYLHFLVPPMLNPGVYSIKTREIRVQVLKMLHPQKLCATGVKIRVGVLSQLTGDISESTFPPIY